MDKKIGDKDSKKSVTLEEVLCHWYLWIPIGYAAGDMLGDSSTSAYIGLVVGGAFGWLLQEFYKKKTKEF